MPPKKANRTEQMKDVIGQILYACTGDVRQYDETINTVVGALETYLTQLAVTALKHGTTPGKVKPEDIIAALKNCDPMKHSHVQDNFLDHRRSMKKDKPDKDMGM